MTIAVIGGSGLSRLGFFGNEEMIEVRTAFGQVEVFKGKHKGKTVYFLPRHGSGHSLPPHLVKYKANIAALKELEVRRIIATSAVGTINASFEPGSFVFPDQFIDMTKLRDMTFSREGYVIHVDMTEPFCPEIRKAGYKSSLALSNKAFFSATYVVTEGPRFETPAEIEAFRKLGGDLVGMTLSPECVLAREMEMCYATFSIVTNYAAGVSKKTLSAKEVDEMVAKKGKLFIDIIFKSIELLEDSPKCSCQNALKQAEI